MEIGGRLDPHRLRSRLLPADGVLGPHRVARARRLLPIYALLLPGLLLYGVWAAYPLISSFLLSFTDWNLVKPTSFVGLDNYTRALGDPLFWRSLCSTLGYTVVTVVGQLILGLGAALLLNQRSRAGSVLRLVYYLPVITSWVIVSLVFLYLYNGQAGALNWLLNDVLGVIDKDVAWLAEPSTALWAIAILGIWKGIGWTMVVFLAGLQSVPDELYEAASDGRRRHAGRASGTSRCPSCASTSTFLLVVLTIGGFNAFISIFVMSSAATGTIGGPLNSTDVVLTYMWKQAFREIDLGYGAALSFLAGGRRSCSSASSSSGSSGARRPHDAPTRGRPESAVRRRWLAFATRGRIRTRHACAVRADGQHGVQAARLRPRDPAAAHPRAARPSTTSSRPSRRNDFGRYFLNSVFVATVLDDPVGDARVDAGASSSRATSSRADGCCSARCCSRSWSRASSS